jgi:glycosyltransferase involved in cell wall biosynthesis
LEQEKEDLLQMHIGVMPLKKGPWFEGKCGFKLIQYQACGIPAVASNVGVNPLITIHEKTGFISNSEADWSLYLKKLILDADLRKNMGKEGRKFINENFSLNNHFPAFISLFS